MDYKICNKCGVEKTLDSFEFRKDKNNYRSTCKECRNKQKREKYQLNKDFINQKRREKYNINKDEINQNRREHYNENKDEYNTKRRNRNNDPMSRLRIQLMHSINKAYERKGFVRDESYEEILGYPIDNVIDYLLVTYKSNYKKEWDGILKFDIDHIVPIWTAKTEDELKKLCKRGNLQLLTKEENHRKGGKMSNGRGKYVYVDKSFFED